MSHVKSKIIKTLSQKIIEKSSVLLNNKNRVYLSNSFSNQSQSETFRLPLSNFTSRVIVINSVIIMKEPAMLVKLTGYIEKVFMTLRHKVGVPNFIFYKIVCLKILENEQCSNPMKSFHMELGLKNNVRETPGKCPGNIREMSGKHPQFFS